jgi:hypothetical protein
MVNRKQVVFVVGLVLALTGAFLMWEGSILGERTIPAAITLGIVGISLIAISKFRLLK